MPSITSWTRLEPLSRRKGIDTGLQARVYDPLWMIARQWQVGEFRAADAGSPVLARLRAETSRITRYAAGVPGQTGSEARPYDGLAPLETLVERENAMPAGGRQRCLRLACEAGQRFLLLLAAQGVGKYREAFIRKFAIPPAAAAADEETRRFTSLVAGRAPDGDALFAALRTARRPATGAPGLPAEPAIEAADRDAVGRAADDFLAWYERFISEPAAKEPSPWVPERMEYCFAVSAPTSAGEHVLAAREYVEGRLDWHSFDALPGSTLGATAAQSPPETIVRTVIPTPAAYRGMPATRWWEFEDATVDFGSVESPPSDLTRLLLLDFLMQYSNDWFVMPVEVEVGSVCTVQSLVVVDTFGERTLVRHYSEVDGAAGQWHLFRSSLDAQGRTAPQPARSRLFLAPTLAAGQNGQTIEEVLFLRDELANLAFGVERIVEGASGAPVHRFEDYQAKREQANGQAPVESPAADELRYRLATQVPDYWIPLMPVQTADMRSVRLRRARLLSSNGGGTELPVPQGRILQPGAPLSLFEEEVPRSGARVTRSWQYARWLDGSTHVWIGRRKQPGRGEGSSGLRFDAVAAP